MEEKSNHSPEVLPDHIREGRVPPEKLNAIHVQRHGYSELSGVPVLSTVFTSSLLCCTVHIAIRLKQNLATIFNKSYELASSFNQASPLISNTLTYWYHYMHGELQLSAPGFI